MCEIINVLLDLLCIDKIVLFACEGNVLVYLNHAVLGDIINPCTANTGYQQSTPYDTKL